MDNSNHLDAKLWGLHISGNRPLNALMFSFTKLPASATTFLNLINSTFIGNPAKFSFALIAVPGKQG